MTTSDFRAGDWVEVRTREEILATLDAEGRHGALPFMPEMLQHCGRRYRVFKSAHKGCDTISDWRTMRRLDGAVHLEGLRCDGGAHGGCQAACLILWKNEWLKPVSGPDAGARPAGAAPAGGVCSLESLERSTRVTPPGGAETFRCQATEHLRATSPLRWWEPGAYLKDLTSRNVKPLEFLRYVLLALWNTLLRRLGRPTHPHVQGLAGEKTPTERLGLEPGELVQVRPADEIMRTINAERKNRGLTFDVEMLPFCGRTFRVLRRVEKLINERTGVMMRMPADCIVLDDVYCRGCLSQYRLFCPRAIYPYWREIWLRRVE
ncbi:MAG: hypothetical protein ACHQ6T_07500 [Myxococcota bacterium]